MLNHNNKSGEPDRRNFLKKAAAIGLGALAGSSSVWRPRQASAQITIPKESIPRRAFGRSGIMVSTLSLGGMFDILNNRLMLAKALEWGVDYWDTAGGVRRRSKRGGNRSLVCPLSRYPQASFLGNQAFPEKRHRFYATARGKPKKAAHRLCGPALCSWNQRHK